ncbi:MAG: hypothetical protein EBR82_68375 [Caulobacteraceae bacterium]|nr:hypothetical protein [Caulobacteraceae bacterium]
MNKIIRHTEPRDMILESLKKAYLKEDSKTLVDRVMEFYVHLSDYELCQRYSEKFETNSKYIAEQFEFNF